MDGAKKVIILFILLDFISIVLNFKNNRTVINTNNIFPKSINLPYIVLIILWNVVFKRTLDNAATIRFTHVNIIVTNKYLIKYF